MNTVWILKISLQLAHIAVVMLGSLRLIGGEPWIEIAPLWVAIAVPLPVLSNLWHYRLLKRAGGNVAQPTRLVTSGGLYRFLRHPMYLGDVLTVILLSLACLNGLVLATACCTIGAILWLARVEDRTLRQQFEAGDQVWFQRTGLLLPAWTRL
jgi:protein-S-isoprenylcysteine O-methyltransferase Ste14